MEVVAFLYSMVEVGCKRMGITLLVAIPREPCEADYMSDRTSPAEPRPRFGISLMTMQASFRAGT